MNLYLPYVAAILISLVLLFFGLSMKKVGVVVLLNGFIAFMGLFFAGAYGNVDVGPTQSSELTLSVIKIVALQLLLLLVIAWKNKKARKL
jgi:hypothetical protein